MLELREQLVRLVLQERLVFPVLTVVRDLEGKQDHQELMEE